MNTKSTALGNAGKHFRAIVDYTMPPVTYEPVTPELHGHRTVAIAFTAVLAIIGLITLYVVTFG